MNNSVINGNTGQPSTSIKDEINDLHFKYLFSIAYLTPQQEHILLEEEKKFFKHVFENKDKLFSIDADNKLPEFTKYTKELMNNVAENYLQVFSDKTLNIDTNDIVTIVNSFDFHFKRLQNELKEQIQNDEDLPYIKCVLICSSLLFLTRTTKRALFIFISEQPNKKPFDIFINLSYVIEYLVLFIQSIEGSLKKQNDLFKDLIQTKDDLTIKQKQVETLTKQYNNAVEEIYNLENKVHQLEQTLNDNNKTNQEQLDTHRQSLQVKQKSLEELQLLKTNLEKKINELEQENNSIIKRYEESLQQTINDYQTLQEQLKNCHEEKERLKNDPDFQKQLVTNAIEETKNYKYLFSGMINLSIKFKQMLDRWEQNMLNSDLIYTKIKNNIIGLDKSTSMLIQNGLNVLTRLYGDVTISYPSTIRLIHNGLELNGHNTDLKQNFINLAKLMQILIDLNDKPILEKKDEMKVFYNSEELYIKLLLLYEDLSGAVRAVVRVRDVYALSPVKISGGNMKNNQKRKSKEQQFTINKRRKVNLWYGGKDSKRYDKYEVQLDKANKYVNFSGIDRKDEVFTNKTLQHGPFFSVHNNEFNNPKSKSFEDDLLNGIGFDSLTNIFNGTNKKGDEPAIIMYTYGYSGSGKSYTLFGEKTLSTELPKKGVVWEIVRRLQTSYDMKLVNTTICYGYLDYEEDGYVFKTNEAKPNVINNTDTNKWASIVNKEFDDALKVKNDDSFIKVTPNNPESSRGFYIIKIALYEKNSNYKTIKGYIGVVDMAGNEDPFDIATSICPTMKFDMMDVLLKDPEKSYIYDVVYEEIKNVLIDILKPTILKVLTAKQVGYVTELAKTQSSSKVLDDRLDATSQERLVTLRDKLDDTFSIFKKPRKEPIYNKSDKKYIKVTEKSPSYIFTYVNDSTEASETLMEVPKTGNVKFNLTAELLQEICIYITNKYKIDNNSSNVTINDIREAILLGQQDKASSLKLEYAIARLTHLIKLKEGETIVTMMINVSDVFQEIMNGRYNAARNIIQGSIIKSMDIFNRNPYILPFMMNNNPVQYNYNTIARIIKEGYYINKANAELMDYFKKKIYMQDINNIVTVNKRYNFDASFSFANYDKFSKDFLPIMKSNTNANSSNKDFEYDTILVDIIRTQFPGKNKDIIFACVRNDKDFGKILGAIDTLELIRNLKST
jgi:hypothetical protein